MERVPEIPAHLVALLQSQQASRADQADKGRAGRPPGRPQPLLEARTRMEISFQELLDLGHEVMGVGEESYKAYRRDLRDYLAQAGWLPDDLVPETFPQDLERLLKASPPVHPNPRQVRIKSSRLRKWPQVWAAWVRGKHLPTTFQGAFTYLFERARVTQNGLASYLDVSDRTVRDYLAGTTEPSRGVLEKLESYFGLEEGVLAQKVKPRRNGPVNRVKVKPGEFSSRLQGTKLKGLRAKVNAALPEDFRSRPIDERTRLQREAEEAVLEVEAERRRRRKAYGVKAEFWPESLAREWEEFQAFKTGTRKDGAGDDYIPAIDPSSMSGSEAGGTVESEATMTIYRDVVERFIGYVTTVLSEGVNHED